MTRMIYDPNQPSKAMSLANLRSTLGGLHQMDLAPLRVRASTLLDNMEYVSNALAQNVWSGTGVTVTSSGTAQQGSNSVQAVIDGTGNRILARSQTLDLAAFGSVKLWHRATSASATFKFFLEDSSGNISYWNVTTSGTANTWVQATLALSSPSSNNGTNADLSDITDWGFSSLQASKTYLFDETKAICGMNVAVGASDVGAFYRNVYIENQPVETDSQTSPTITAPTSNPRIDILIINSAGALAWVTGTQASSPVPNWNGLANNVLPIALVYMKTTMARVVDYEDKDGNPNEGYILADVRPFLNLGSSDVAVLTDEDGDTKIQVEESPDEDVLRIDINGQEVLNVDSNYLSGRMFYLTDIGVNLIRNADFSRWTDSSTPQEWDPGGGATLARESGIPNVQYGQYSLKLTADADGSLANQTAFVISSSKNTLYRGKKVTFSCWVKTSTASNARLNLKDGIGNTNSSYHSGGGTWEQLVVTRTTDAAATSIIVELKCDANGGIAYFDGAQLSLGGLTPSFLPRPSRIDQREDAVYDNTLSATATGSFADTGITKTLTVNNANNLIEIYWELRAWNNANGGGLTAHAVIDGAGNSPPASACNGSANTDVSGAMTVQGKVMTKLAAGSHTVKVQFRNQSAGTVTALDGRLYIKEVDNG